MDGDTLARGGLGTAGSAAFVGGLGVLVPGWNDLLLAFVNEVAGTRLYELPPALGWVLLALGTALLTLAFFGPARVAGWIDGLGATPRAKSVLVLRPIGFSPAVRAPTLQELDRASESDDFPVDVAALLQAGNIDGALAEHERRMSQLEAVLAARPNALFAYAGIVQAPFQVLAGYRLSSWTAANLLEWSRTEHFWRALAPGNGSDLGLARTDETTGTGVDVALALEISYPIATAPVVASVPAAGRIIRLSLARPTLDAVTHMGQATAIASMTRAILDEIASQSSPGARVHIFIAGPMSVGFRVGQMISRTLHPLIHVYAYTMNAQPPYPWGLVVNPAVGAPQVVRN